MLPDDYCDIFCADILRCRLNRQVADWNHLIMLDNGDGLGMGRIESVHDIFTNTDSCIFHFDYIPFESCSRTPNWFLVVAFRLVVTIHHVDDSEIPDECL